MKQSRKIYSAEFKKEIVLLSSEIKKISKLTREFGITSSQLYKWKRELNQHGSASFPGNGNKKALPEKLTFTENELITKLGGLKQYLWNKELINKGLSEISNF